MKNYITILVLPLFIGCNSNATKHDSAVAVENPIMLLDSTYLFKANPEEGFNFDYYIYMPDGMDINKSNTLLIETTNTGLNDSIEHHMRGAKHAASKSSVGNFVSKKLKIPLLVPIFPRPESNWQMYVHAFDEETFHVKNSELERLDLQLLAMFKNAKKELSKKGYLINDRFFMTGFSASGTFANRFSILHPDKIKAVCAGGVNSILILPIEKIDGKKLNFPIGIANVQAVTGNKVDLDSYRKLPQFWFMGEEDTNDAAKFDDGYSSLERDLIYSILGEEMIPKRWEKVQMIYKENNIPAVFKTYKDIGHGTDLTINNEISGFFEKHTN